MKSAREQRNDVEAAALARAYGVLLRLAAERRQRARQDVPPLVGDYKPPQVTRERPS